MRPRREPPKPWPSPYSMMVAIEKLKRFPNYVRAVRRELAEGNYR